MIESWIGGEQVIQDDLVVDEAESKLAHFLEHGVEQLKALLDRAFYALVLDREHDGRFDGHLQRAGEPEAQTFNLLIVSHVNSNAARPSGPQTEPLKYGSPSQAKQ